MLDGFTRPSAGEFQKVRSAEGDLSAKLPNLNFFGVFRSQLVQQFERFKRLFALGLKPGEIKADQMRLWFLGEGDSECQFCFRRLFKRRQSERETMVGTGFENFLVDRRQRGLMAFVEALAHLSNRFRRLFKFEVGQSEQ